MEIQILVVKLMQTTFLILITMLHCSIAQTDLQITKQQGNSFNDDFCYTNPITRDTSISMRDHCIIKVGNQWYCTGTSNPVWTGPNPGVRLLVSDDRSGSPLVIRAVFF